MMTIFSVICTPWHQYVYSVTENCLDTALVNNRWAKKSEIFEISDLDKRSLLAISLNSVLDDEEHSLPELQSRDTTAASGGLCGIAATYQALHDTLLTPSQLKKMSHISMKEAILEELGMDLVLAKTELDLKVLKWFFEKICNKHTKSFSKPKGKLYYKISIESLTRMVLLPQD